MAPDESRLGGAVGTAFGCAVGGLFGVWCAMRLELSTVHSIHAAIVGGVALAFVWWRGGQGQLMSALFVAFLALMTMAITTGCP